MDLEVSGAGVHLSLRTPNEIPFALVVPCVDYDGATTFQTSVQVNKLITKAEEGVHSRTISVIDSAPQFEAGETLRTAMGDITPWRIQSNDPILKVHIATD